MKFRISVYGLADSAFTIDCADMAAVERNLTNLAMQVRVPFTVDISELGKIFQQTLIESRTVEPAL